MLGGPQKLFRIREMSSGDGHGTNCVQTTPSGCAGDLLGEILVKIEAQVLP